MSVNATAAPKVRRAAPTSLKVRLHLNDGTVYSAKPLPAGVPGTTVVRVQKLDAKGLPSGDPYDVGFHEGMHGCECLGWLRWRRPCRHMKMLAAIGMLPPLPAPAAARPAPGPEAPASGEAQPESIPEVASG
jgi:hypothetical protein